MVSLEPPILTLEDLVEELKALGYPAKMETTRHWLSSGVRSTRMPLNAFFALLAVLDIRDLAYFAPAIAPEVWARIAGEGTEEYPGPQGR